MYLHSSFVYEAGRDTGLGSGNYMEGTLSPSAWVWRERLGDLPWLLVLQKELVSHLFLQTRIQQKKKKDDLPHKLCALQFQTILPLSCFLLRPILPSTAALIRLSVTVEMCYNCTIQCSSHWPHTAIEQSTWNLASAMWQEVRFFFNFNINLNSWPVATVLESPHLACAFYTCTSHEHFFSRSPNFKEQLRSCYLLEIQSSTGNHSFLRISITHWTVFVARNILSVYIITYHILDQSFLWGLCENIIMSYSYFGSHYV